MKRLIGIVILVPVAILLVAFSVANRADVTVSLDPFNSAAPAVSIAVPLFALLFACLAIGIVLGGVAAWFGQAHWRRETRALRRENRKARTETRELRKAVSPTSPATALPAIRP